MKRLIGLTAAAFVATMLVAPSGAQDDYVPGGGYYPPYYQPYAGMDYRHASTAGEGYARGFASVIRSIGEANLRNSMAAENLADAQSQYLENRLDATKTYFEMRAVNDAYREQMRGPRATSEQLFRYASERAPDRPTPAQLDPVSGEIEWPLALRDEYYAPEMKAMEMLYERRAEKQQLTADDLMAIEEVGERLQTKLKANIESYPPMEYIKAKKFLDGLIYEARFSPAS